MLTKDDLNAIKLIMKDSFSGLEGRLDGLESRLDTVEKDIGHISSLLDNVEQDVTNISSRLNNVEQDVKYVRVTQLENDVIPRLNTIEDCYIESSKRYLNSSDKFEAAIADIGVMKLAIRKNSEDIQELMEMKQA